jgi:hypothetical protein
MMKTTSTSTQKIFSRLFLISLAGLCISLIGCSEDFLERKPKGQLTFDTYFETAEHAEWATNAI